MARSLRIGLTVFLPITNSAAPKEAISPALPNRSAGFFVAFIALLLLQAKVNCSCSKTNPMKGGQDDYCWDPYADWHTCDGYSSRLREAAKMLRKHLT